MHFRKTYIEITNVCNRTCDFCPGTSRRPRFMERVVFQRILIQLRGISRLLHFHVMGEPLLHPELSVFLDLCADHGYRVNLVTNGMLLPAAGGTLFGKTALRQVSISLHHLSEHSSSSELDAYFGGIKECIRNAGTRPDLAVSLRLWNWGTTGSNAFRDDVLGRIADMVSIPRPRLHALAENKPLRLAEHLWLNCAGKFVWPSLDNKDYGTNGTCLGLRQQAAILADGAVVPCCLDRDGIITLGNISSATMADILSCERAAALRKGFSKGVIIEELCRRCSFRLRFNRERSPTLSP